MSEELRKTIMDAMRSVSERADEFKAGCATFDGEWPDAEDKAIYDAEVALVERLRVAFAAISDAAKAPMADEQRAAIKAAADTAHRVLCAGGDYGDELSDAGLRRELKESRDMLRTMLAAPPAAPADTMTPSDVIRDAQRYGKCREHAVKRGFLPTPEQYDAMVDESIERMEVAFRTGHNYGKKVQHDGRLAYPAAPIAADAAAPSDTCSCGYSLETSCNVLDPTCKRNAAQPDERAAFEAHWCRDVPSMYRAAALAEIKANRDGERYKRDEIQWAWEAWQARATAPQATSTSIEPEVPRRAIAFLAGYADSSNASDETQAAVRAVTNWLNGTTAPQATVKGDEAAATLIAIGRLLSEAGYTPELRVIDAVREVISRAAAPQANHAEINEIFERQQAGFARCFEALGIGDDDDRERGWSSLVLAINDARAAALQAGEALTDEQIISQFYIHTVMDDEPLFTFDRKSALELARALLSSQAEK